MAKPDISSKNNDEFTKIFDEYRTKIEEITRRTEVNLQQTDEAPDAESDDNQRKKPVVIISEIKSTHEEKQEPPSDKAEEERQPEKDADKIIKEAKREAQNLIDEAEEKAKKEAKKKTKSQMEKIIDKAKKEAEDITTRAKQEAERERNEIIATSKREAEQLLEGLAEQYRQETQEQFTQVVTEARQKAENIIGDVLNSSTEISHLVTEIVNRTKNTIQEFETRLQTETSELMKNISETQQKLERVTVIAKQEEKEKIEQVDKPREFIDTPALSVRFLNENANGQKGNNSLYHGQVEMISISPSFDYRYLKNLKKYLASVPNIKYLQECASEDETSILFEVKEPSPVLDILSNVPLVEEVINEADDICLVFKNSPE